MHRFRAQISFTGTTLAGICDVNSGVSTSAFAEITNKDTGFKTGWRMLKKLFDSGKGMGVARRYDAQGSLTPTDASGASLSLAVNGQQTYTRNGEVITCTIDVTYPSSSSSSVAAISGLPFTSAIIPAVVEGLLLSVSSETIFSRGAVTQEEMFKGCGAAHLR